MIEPQKPRKFHAPVSCPLALTLEGKAMYQLNAVINHMGENTSSGHYNISVIDVDYKSIILVDDLEIRRKPNTCDMDNVSYVVVYTRQ